MPVSHSHHLIFVHIPKNAGTSITCSPDHQFVHEGHHPIRSYCAWYPTLSSQYFSFAVVRNPWDRCLSNYNYARMEHSYWHSPDGTTRYPVHPDFKRLSRIDFTGCVSILSNEPAALLHKGWLPQYPWVCDFWGRIAVDKIFRYEELDSDP